MLRLIILGIVVFGLVGCGGRVAQPLTATTYLDEQLSCAHIRGELERNILRLAELGEETSQKHANNLGLLIVNPLFIDLSDSLSEEAQSITVRNARLVELANARSCEDIAVGEITD